MLTRIPHASAIDSSANLFSLPRSQPAAGSACAALHIAPRLMCWRSFTQPGGPRCGARFLDSSRCRISFCQERSPPRKIISTGFWKGEEGSLRSARAKESRLSVAVWFSGSVASDAEVGQESLSPSRWFGASSWHSW